MTLWQRFRWMLIRRTVCAHLHRRMDEVTGDEFRLRTHQLGRALLRGRRFGDRPGEHVYPAGWSQNATLDQQPARAA